MPRPSSGSGQGIVSQANGHICLWSGGAGDGPEDQFIPLCFGHGNIGASPATVGTIDELCHAEISVGIEIFCPAKDEPLLTPFGGEAVFGVFDQHAFKAPHPYSAEAGPANGFAGIDGEVSEVEMAETRVFAQVSADDDSCARVGAFGVFCAGEQGEFRDIGHGWLWFWVLSCDDGGK